MDGVDCHVLDLAARGRDVTYARVRYWVAADGQPPGEGRVLRRFRAAAENRALRPLPGTCGRLRPTRLVIEDAVKAGEYSVLEYETMVLREFPDKLFTQQYLQRL